jgi:tRNA(adenine34) deaminase
MNEHLKFLERCRELASEAGRSGNTPVGAVVVHEGVIVGEGMESTLPDNDITRHAEIEAVRDALKRLGLVKLNGCSLYTTHEPCILCSYAIRHYQISWVGFENAVSTVGGFSSAWPILTATNITIWGSPPEVVTLIQPG